MNTDEQRIAIALACGWKFTDNQHGLLWSDSLKRASLVPGSEMSKIKISQCGDDGVRIPDYLNSLDAMHEAEEWLSEGMFDDYVAELMELMHQEHMANEPEFRLIRAVHATAAQRAKAYVNLLNRNKTS